MPLTLTVSPSPYHPHSWAPGFHDPSFLGWLVVAAYAVAAYLCWRAGRVPTPNPFRPCWRVIWPILVVLGVNKQLDLQSALILVMRNMAQQQGWLAYRRVVQYSLILVCLTIGLAALLWAVHWYRRNWRARYSGIDDRYRPRRLAFAAAGAALLATYLLLRIAAISHGGDFLPLDMRQDVSIAAVELVALLLLIVGATGVIPSPQQDEEGAD